MIRGRTRRCYNQFITKYFSKANHLVEKEWSSELKDLHVSDVCYSIEFVEIENTDVKHKWVGAQYYNGSIYAIPNDETRILIQKNEVSYIDAIKEGNFKWTGGCVWNDALYCFPRTANSFLKIREKEAREIPLPFIYGAEHHYSGVCTSEGVVYQPPRNTNHILRTDLNTGNSTKIRIVSDIFRVNFRYCGSIIHPNGYIYFFPENGRTIKLDPMTDRWCFIGKQISTMCFDAKIGIDGNIYGYSAYQPGIMKIDVTKDKVEMIHKEIKPGAYGTKYGLDACLYSIPGDGNSVWKYNIEFDKLEKIYDLQDNSKAKYAGGATLPNGCIVCIPATANRILVFKPNTNEIIPEELYKEYFADNY